MDSRRLLTGEFEDDVHGLDHEMRCVPRQLVGADPLDGNRQRPAWLGRDGVGLDDIMQVERQAQRIEARPDVGTRRGDGDTDGAIHAKPNTDAAAATSAGITSGRTAPYAALAMSTSLRP